MMASDFEGSAPRTLTPICAHWIAQVTHSSQHKREDPEKKQSCSRDVTQYCSALSTPQLHVEILSMKMTESVTRYSLQTENTLHLLLSFSAQFSFQYLTVPTDTAHYEDFSNSKQPMTPSGIPVRAGPLFHKQDLQCSS